MKWVAMLLALCASGAMAQVSSPEAQHLQDRPAALNKDYVASYKDVYCAGFVSRERFNAANHVVGGRRSPDQLHFGLNETVFLAGSGYQVGEKYAVIRDLRDENSNGLYPNQHKEFVRLGHQYAELGHIRVTSLENGNAMATIEASCQSIVPGDFVIPFRDRGSLVVPPRSIAFPVFGVATPARHGQIVAANEFDSILGTHRQVYIDLGSKSGLKPGDYLRISRSYDPAVMPAVDKLMLSAPRYDESQRGAPRTPPKSMKNWPAKGVGEMVVISVTPDTATCLTTLALEEIQLGDMVAPENER